MTEQIKIDFEKTIKTLDLSKDDVKLKKNFQIDLQKRVFLVENLKIGNSQT